MKKSLLFILFSLFTLVIRSQDSVIYLYKGIAPGSEKWNWDERNIHANGMNLYFDVSKPSLTPYIPLKPNGTAIIIAPGGAFHALAFDIEGTNVAKWLNDRGITVFVLKYRLGHDDPA